MGLLKILFIILIIIFPIAEVGRIQFSNGIAISLNDVVLFVTIISWFIYRFTNKQIRNQPFLTKPILIFSVVALFSLILGIFNFSFQNILISSLYLLRWISYALLYFIILDFDSKFRKTIVNTMLFSGLLVVIAGYIQFYLYPNLKNLYYLGWDDHLYRMFSTFLDPNFAGAFFVIYFLFTVFFVFKFVKEKNNLKVILILLASLLSLGAIYLTYSRGAFIMLVIGLLSFLWFKGKRKILIAVFLVLVTLIFLAPKSFKLEGTNFLRVVSTQGRIANMQQGLELFAKNPVMGVGFNSYRYALNKYFGMNNSIWKTTHAGAGNDNSYIFVLATTGVVGFSVFLFLIYRIFVLVRVRHKNEYAILFISVFLGLLINSMFTNSLFYVLILEWIWILAGFTESS